MSQIFYFFFVLFVSLWLSSLLSPTISVRTIEKLLPFPGEAGLIAYRLVNNRNCPLSIYWRKKSGHITMGVKNYRKIFRAIQTWLKCNKRAKKIRLCRFAVKTRLSRFAVRKVCDFPYSFPNLKEATPLKGIAFLFFIASGKSETFRTANRLSRIFFALLLHMSQIFLFIW